MSRIKLMVTNSQKAIKLPDGVRPVIRKCCLAVMADEGFDRDAEVSLTFVDNEEIQRLNNEFRGKDAVTDVLSFPMSDDGNYDFDPDSQAFVLGDIVISLERAKEQAEEYGHSFTREIAFLVTHSMLHLFGYDHVDDPEGERVMIEKQKKVLKQVLTAEEYTPYGETKE